LRDYGQNELSEKYLLNGGLPVLKDIKVIELIESSGLERVKQSLIDISTNSIRMNSSVIEEGKIPIGHTKIGGRPDLPSHLQWPNKDGKYLSFIAQINLNEIPMVKNEFLELPAEGLLCFFYDAEEQPWGYDPEDRGRWKVVYIEKTDELVRRGLPEELSQEGAFETCKVEFSIQTTLPSWESILIDQLNLDEDETDLYLELIEKVFEYNGSDASIHRFLGHPDHLQGEMQLECQLASNGLYVGDSTGYENPRRMLLQPDAISWNLLLQIDSEEEIGMTWGDVGRIYFWIHEDDLIKKDFNNVWLVLQCF
jgi:uncharacterized protein YwqG